MVITKVIAYLTSKNEMKENILVNMVLAITIRIKVLKNVAFKDKEPFKSIEVTTWAMKKKLQLFFSSYHVKHVKT
jgi:hypothetical protein